VWAAEAGCSALSCWLIAHHQSPVESIDEMAVGGGEARTLLAALQDADNGN
jgi:hypothetical protein